MLNGFATLMAAATAALAPDDVCGWLEVCIMAMLLLPPDCCCCLMPVIALLAPLMSRSVSCRLRLIADWFVLVAASELLVAMRRWYCCKSVI